ncbi:thioredoxin domain-containing protein [Aurantivibrio plasticivorans]
MKRKALFSRIAKGLVPLATFALAAGATAAPTKVGDFGLIDHVGDQHQLSRLGYHKAVVVISQDNSCQANIDNLPKYKLLRTTFEPMGVKFLMMNASGKDSLQSVQKLASIYDIDFPIMIDDTQLATETLGVKQAGEILVLDPKSNALVYRGPLDSPPNRRAKTPGTTHLADAIQAVLDGKHTQMATKELPVEAACDLEFPVKAMHAKAAPDYAEDVAPILEKNCVHCHVQGGIGPFAMDSYQMVRGFAPMIREVVMTKRMPPAQVDPTYNHFTNANYLTKEETQTLVHWIDAGAKRGDSKVDPLTTVAAIEQGWQLDEEPDLIIEVPSFTVPATGVLDYFNNVIKLDFEEDKYVRAVQFIPGDKRVLHHLLAYITSPGGDNRVLNEEDVRDFLEGYAPGKTDVTVFPENTGVFIPKGFELSMQMHYTTFGKEVVDSTKVGLWFHDKKPEYKYLTKSVSLGGPNLTLRPNEPEHAMNNHYVFDHDTMLYAMRPHMHYRGKAFRFSAIYPDGRREVLLNVPNYNFAWQPTYRLEKPIFLPAGTRVVNDAVFDNSEFNPGNPDPATVVKGGAQSWDEMFIGYYTYTNLEEGTPKYSQN